MVGAAQRYKELKQKVKILKCIIYKSLARGINLKTISKSKINTASDGEASQKTVLRWYGLERTTSIS